MNNGNFSNLGGETVDYFDKRFGRILLSDAISVASNVQCNTNYTAQDENYDRVYGGNISGNNCRRANRFSRRLRRFGW